MHRFQQLADAPWSTRAGIPIPEYATPSSYEKHVVRTLTNPKGEPRTQHARTPHHLVNGTFTPILGATSPYLIPTGSAPALFYRASQN